MTRWTEADARLYELRRAGKNAPAKSPRIRSTKTEVDGVVFQSKREAERYLQLKMELKLERISKLRLQVPFSLAVNRIHVCVYRADFVYERNGVETVEDVKGHRTEVYIIKKKLMAAVHGIEIQEV